MKAVSAALAILFLSPQEDEAAKKAQRIDRALGWLVDADADVREMGRKDLLQIGADAMPAIEKKIAEKGATELVRMLRHFDRHPRVSDAWIDEKEIREIEADEQFRREAEKLPKDAAEKFAYVKYQEALAHFRRKNYQRSFDMANALVALESRSAHLETFKRLRRQSENMITQTSLIEAKVMQPKLWYVEGEPVELAARMKNLYRSMITMNWEKGTEKDPGGGLLVVEVEVSMSDFGGASSSDQRHQEIRFEEEVPIAPGAQWERKFALDTSTAIADSKQIRVIKVGAWTQPLKITAETIGITRKIQFEPAVLKVIPKKYAPFMENPLLSLEKQIAEGSPQEIYICCQLLEGADRDRGTVMLIGLLARSNTVISKNIAANLLAAHTGQALGTDPRRWENWYSGKGAEDKDKKKK